ncbi:MAG: radical SAM protein [Deltaproteobacteria bacterium]|nr:radical SAM protein [Deltaproteobacteria bacterium]
MFSASEGYHWAVIVNLHVTGDCNLRCDYCYASPKTRARMDRATARQAVSLAASQATDVHVMFFGGEPLLERSLIEQVVQDCELGLCGQARFYFQVVTNGTLVDDDVVAWAAQHQVSISVSLDGCREAHDRHRTLSGGEGSFAQTVRSIPLLLANNPYLHVQMVISPDTASLLPQSLEFVFGLGVRHVSTSINYQGPWDRSSLERLGHAYEKAARLYEKKTLRGDRFFLSCFDARIRTRVRGPCTEEERCTAGMHQFSVSPSGRIYPCVQFVGDDQGGGHVLGHVSTGFEPLARERFHEASEAAKPQCQGCALLGRCSCWCACVNWATTGNLAQVSPVLCEHERMLMPMADVLASRLFSRRNTMFIHKHYNAAFPILSVAEDILEAAER